VKWGECVFLEALAAPSTEVFAVTQRHVLILLRRERLVNTQISVSDANDCMQYTRAGLDVRTDLTAAVMRPVVHHTCRLQPVVVRVSVTLYPNAVRSQIAVQQKCSLQKGLSKLARHRTAFCVLLCSDCLIAVTAEHGWFSSMFVIFYSPRERLRGVQ
jgi:hypothetical protein